MGRNKDRKRARTLEIPRCTGREFIMRLYVVIKKVAIKLEPIATDLIVERDVTAPAFLFRKGTRECVEVKAGQQTAGPPYWVSRVVDRRACRSEAVGTGRRGRKCVSPWGES